ncbi:MAG: DUF4386 domain-containing protein [Actinomycetia bacterium]|nr:DUF4386 domain-containing protein [Actinomycetes bacterium]
MNTTMRPKAVTATMAAPSTHTTPAGLDIAPRQAALVAGVGYVLLFALGIFANFLIREGLIVTDDAQETAANIAQSEGLFRFGLASFLLIFVIDVAVAWALYIVFRPANRDLSLVAAWFRLIYTVFLGVALIFFFQALQLLSGADFLTTFGRDQLDAQALVALDTFNSTWLIGLVAFGIHLVLLGFLMVRSRYAPKILGYLMIAAGTAYVIDTFAHSLLDNYKSYETLFITMVAVPSIISEGWFGLWLLFRGGKAAGRQPSPAPSLDRTPSAVSGPPAHPGADADDVLAAAGYGADEIARLRDEGAIR